MKNKKQKQKIKFIYKGKVINVPSVLVGNVEITSAALNRIKGGSRAFVALLLMNHNRLKADFKHNINIRHDLEDKIRLLKLRNENHIIEIKNRKTEILNKCMDYDVLTSEYAERVDDINYLKSILDQNNIEYDLINWKTAVDTPSDSSITEAATKDEQEE